MNASKKSFGQFAETRHITVAGSESIFKRTANNRKDGEERKTNDPHLWAQEAELLARFFLNGLCLEEGGSGWGAVLIVSRFKELLCRKLEHESLDEGVKYVPASAFVYAMQ